MKHAVWVRPTLLGCAIAVTATLAHAQYIDWSAAAQAPSQIAAQQLENAREQQALRQQQEDAENARIAFQQQQQDADQRADRARRAGSLMAAGDCVGAKNVALAEGDFDMAQRVVALCTATPSPGR